MDENLVCSLLCSVHVLTGYLLPNIGEYGTTIMRKDGSYC